MANNILEGSKVLAIGNGNNQYQVEFISEYEQKESRLKLVYYMWLSRFFTFLAIISLSVFLCASLALFRLAPQVTVKPFLIVSQDKSSEIVRAEGMDLNMPSKDKLVKTFIKQYVELRNTMIDDQIEMRTRWQAGGMLNFLSAPAVFNEFDAYREKVLNQQILDNTIQEVEIISVNRIGGQYSPLWKVDFKTYTINKKDQEGKQERVMDVKYWTASVTAVLIKERLFVGRRLVNPLGFTVLRYSQTEVEVL